jgi:hypothetical protein
MVGATVQGGEIVNASRSTVLRRITVVIESGHGFTPLTCGHFEIRGDMIQTGMAEQQLHGVERVHCATTRPADNLRPLWLLYPTPRPAELVDPGEIVPQTIGRQMLGSREQWNREVS